MTTRNPLNVLSDLQMLVSEMEHDLGLAYLGQIEKKVLLAIADVAAKNGSAQTHDVLGHSLLSSFSRPSLFRALKTLTDEGKLLKVTDKRGYYAPNI